MAGTIFGLPLSQRVDLNGSPSVGWLLYIYQANTSTPVNSYQDTALTVLNPWPLPADAYGMMRQFWLADGSYRARATSSDGSLTYFDQLSILALGASSGAAPSGGVDAASIFQTGDVIWADRTGTRTGWVRDNARTIGSATSGADERANADCQPLFEFLWNTYDDTLCPVVGSRGASSLTDWTANKKITLPDKRGVSVIGADGMGNSAAGRLDDTPWLYGDSDTAGSVVGENSHQLTEGEMPSHGHSGGGTTDGESDTHTHTETTVSGPGGSNRVPVNNSTSASATGGDTQTGTESTGHTHNFGFNTDPAGGDAVHNNVQISIVGTFYRKL